MIIGVRTMLVHRELVVIKIGRPEMKLLIVRMRMRDGVGRERNTPDPRRLSGICKDRTLEV